MVGCDNTIFYGQAANTGGVAVAGKVIGLDTSAIIDSIILTFAEDYAVVTGASFSDYTDYITDN